MNIMKNIDQRILSDARAGLDQTVYLAVAILRVDGEPDRLVFSSPEYGDYAGIEQMWDFIESCEPLLRPGESLHLELRSIAWQDMHLQHLDKVGKCLPR
jgi:hypothetical protein